MMQMKKTCIKKTPALDDEKDVLKKNLMKMKKQYYKNIAHDVV